MKKVIKSATQTKVKQDSVTFNVTEDGREIWVRCPEPNDNTVAYYDGVKTVKFETNGIIWNKDYVYEDSDSEDVIDMMVGCLMEKFYENGDDLDHYQQTYTTSREGVEFDVVDTPGRCAVRAKVDDIKYGGFFGVEGGRYILKFTQGTGKYDGPIVSEELVKKPDDMDSMIDYIIERLLDMINE